MKKIIAVDIDDVLAAEAEFIIGYSNEHWGHTLKLDEYHEHWTEMWQVSHEEAERRALKLHEPGIVSQYRLLDARNVLQKLQVQYELVILSSRWESVRDETGMWLQQNFGNLFKEVHFTGFYDSGKEGGHLLSKAELSKQIGADYLIDDQPKHCFGAAEAGVQAILFGNYAVGRHLNLLKNVTRCKDWPAVLEYFDKRTTKG